MPLGYIIVWSGRFPHSNSWLDFPSPHKKCQKLFLTPSRLFVTTPLSPLLVPLHTLGVFTQRLSPAGILFSLNGSCTFNSNVASAKFSQVLCRPCLLSGMYPRALSSFSVLALSTLSCNYLPCAPPPYRPTTSGEHVLIISLLWEPVTVPGTGWCPVSSWRKDCSGTPPKTPLYWLLSGHRWA